MLFVYFIIMDTTKKLLTAIDKYKEKHCYADSTASKKLMGSGDWLAKVRSGKQSMTLRTIDKIVAKLAEDGIAV